MNMYPTEDGFKDEREEPIKEIDYRYDGDCDNYTYDGHCPCCGDYVITVGGNYHDDPQYDACHTCGWVSDVEY